jgi:ABC-type bacteriocin/lantibiotic exporter with double-glycine peptidase domain
MAPSSFVPEAKILDKDLSIEYNSGEALMARGPLALNDHVATRIKTALGQPMPQMEVRFHKLSISGEVVVKDETDVKSELPTLVHTVKMAALRLSAKKHVVKKEILRNVSGVLKASSMTLVLGQPGSGKSSLLKVLSGRFPAGKRVRVDGQVTYNGAPQEELRHRLPQLVSFVDQHDKHFPTW